MKLINLINLILIILLLTTGLGWGEGTRFETKDVQMLQVFEDDEINFPHIFVLKDNKADEEYLCYGYVDTTTSAGKMSKWIRKEFKIELITKLEKEAKDEELYQCSRCGNAIPDSAEHMCERPR